MRIALFVTCLTDTLFPATGQAVVPLLERLGHQLASRIVGSTYRPAPPGPVVLPVQSGFVRIRPALRSERTCTGNYFGLFFIECD